jgi:hypothetical protein
VAQEHGNRYVRHVRLDAPLEIIVDGLSRRGVVMKPGMPFDMYVGQVWSPAPHQGTTASAARSRSRSPPQVDAFMALQEGEYNSAS